MAYGNAAKEAGYVTRLIVPRRLSKGQEESAGRIFVGDVRDVQDGIRHGANNQKIAQWPHGQFFDYLADKARRIDIHVAYIAEDGSTVTCSACGQRQMSAPRRRTVCGTGCGTLHHRDANGAANICSRGCCGQYRLVGVERITHQRPIAAGQLARCASSTSSVPADWSPQRCALAIRW